MPLTPFRVPENQNLNEVEFSCLSFMHQIGMKWTSESSIVA